jgi:hypothetical protein
VPVPPTPTPAERFATLIRWLSGAVWTRNHFGLPMPLIGLIIDRLREINQRFARLAARIREGRYVPRRRSGSPRSPGPPRPRPPNKLPQDFGWLLKLVPEAVGYRSQLEYLLRDEEIAALLAAAPASMARPLRSLCHMLGLRPPPILPPPPGARRKTRSAKAERSPARQRVPRQTRVRYVFGLRYPPPFPDPA